MTPFLDNPAVPLQFTRRASTLCMGLCAALIAWSCTGSDGDPPIDMPADAAPDAEPDAALPPPPVEGCTDSSADNYDPIAEVDNGSCAWACLDYDVDHWETVVFEDDIWSYQRNDPPPGWTEVGFDASGWSSGPGGLGYGDDDDNTVVGPTVSLFIRTTFDIVDVEPFVGALLHLDYDDAFVAYINGVEVARANIGTVGVPPVAAQLASQSHEAIMVAGRPPPVFSVDVSLLQAGENTLAIQVHNRDAASSDMSIRPFLSVGLNGPGQTYRESPAWWADTFISSNLPVAVIHTAGETIVDDPRIVAQLGVTRCEQGGRNFLSEPHNDYQGLMSIEFRGSSSQSFPKKSFGVETQDALGENNDVSIMGLPADDDWIFYAPYSDKSLMRNALAMNYLGQRTVDYASRGQYFELLIDGEYQGVYLLMEKVKRSSNRVDIDRMESIDIAGDEVTGGFIFKVDKFTGSGGEGWDSSFDPPGWRRPFFQYQYPKFDDIQPEQALFIQDHVQRFEQALLDVTFADPEIGYRAYADADSFIDYYLVQELSRNVDAYSLSTFLHKNKDSLGGALRMGPLWDFNLGFGNANYNDAWQIDGWALDDGAPFWWDRMLQDPVYIDALQCRWQDLRANSFSTEAMFAFIDSTEEYLDEAQQRNFARWPILGMYVWPNVYVGGTYEADVYFLKSWLSTRADWLDDNLPGQCPQEFVGSAGGRR